MRRGLRIGLLAASVVGVSVFPLRAEARVASINNQTSVDGRTWSLGGSGYVPQALRVGKNSLGKIELPPDAGKRGATWFVVDLSVDVALANGDTGTGYISAAVNDRTAIQIKITGSADGPRYSMVGLVGGRESGPIAGQGQTLAVANYAQAGSVTGGSNRVAVSLEERNGLKFQSVTVRDSSGIRETTDSPYPLQLHIMTDGTANVRPGQVFEVPLTLSSRRKGLTLSDVAVAVVPSEGLEVIGSEQVRISRLTGAFPAVFRLRALEEGTFSLSFFTQSEYNRPSRVIGVLVRSRGGMSVVKYSVWGFSGALVCAGFFVLFRRRSM